MLILIAIKMMKQLIIIFVLLTVNISISQNKESYDLYLFNNEKCELFFKKSAEVKGQDFYVISYSLRIPNQHDSRFVFNFMNKDSTDLGWTIKGGNGSDYDFNFFYDSRELETKFMKEGEYIKNKILISYLLSSNLEILNKVLGKASKIYILEKTEKPEFKYIAREVRYSIDVKL